MKETLQQHQHFRHMLKTTASTDRVVHSLHSTHLHVHCLFTHLHTHIHTCSENPTVHISCLSNALRALHVISCVYLNAARPQNQTKATANNLQLNRMSESHIETEHYLILQQQGIISFPFFLKLSPLSSHPI